jgi:hypothetical protein
MARPKGSPTGDIRDATTLSACVSSVSSQAGASIKGTARKFAIDYHALRRHWRNHVSAEARAGYIAGAGATKDQLEEIVTDESLGLCTKILDQKGPHGFNAISAPPASAIGGLSTFANPVRLSAGPVAFETE